MIIKKSMTNNIVYIAEDPHAFSYLFKVTLQLFHFHQYVHYSFQLISQLLFSALAIVIT